MTHKARDDYPYLAIRRDAYVDGEPGLGFDAYQALVEIDRLRDENYRLKTFGFKTDGTVEWQM